MRNLLKMKINFANFSKIKMSRLFTFINFAGLGMSAAMITSIAHMFAVNTVDNMERMLRKDGADPSAFVPIYEWRKKSFLKQIMSNPSWNEKN